MFQLAKPIHMSMFTGIPRLRLLDSNRRLPFWSEQKRLRKRLVREPISLQMPVWLSRIGLFDRLRLLPESAVQQGHMHEYSWIDIRLFMPTGLHRTILQHSNRLLLVVALSKRRYLYTTHQWIQMYVYSSVYGTAVSGVD